MKLFTTIMGLLLLGNLGAAELLKNHDFSAKNSNNLPKDWTCRGGAEAFNFDSGTVKMNRKGADNVILQQDKLNIVPGKKYRFSCEVTAPKGTDYMIYYEALLDGKFITEPVVRKAGNGKTEKISCIIVKPLKAKSDRLMIRLMNQSGIEVSNLHLDEETESVQSKSDEHGIFFDAPSPDKKDVLYNGNMERGPARWELLPGARVVRTNDRLGNRGLELAAKGIAGQKGLFLESNQKWRLTFFAKNTSDSPEAQFNVFFRSNDFNSNPERKLFTVKSNQYQRYEIIFQIPGNGERKMINLFCENPGKATVILDEFYLDAPANQPKVALKFDPEFWRGFLYQSLNQPKLTGFAETTLPQAAKIVVSLKKDHAVLNKVTLTPANLKFTFPVENLANGDYLLIGEVFDANNKLCGQTELPFKKLPPVANEVLIDSKQNFIVDGKRFYPIALLDVYDRPGTNYMGYISARNGVNALFSRLIFDEAGALKALDYAKSLGLKSILCIGGFKEIAIGRDFKRQWQEKINKILTPAVISHEALFIYEYGDEGVGNDIPDAAYVEAIKIMNEVDPYHPVFLNESPRGTVVEYLKKHSAGAAVFGVDIYPVPESIRHSCLPNKTISSVGDYGKLYAESAPGKPLLFWLQAFDWGALGQPDKTGLPNVAEQRFMNFDALLNQVKGIIYYNDGNDDQAYYNGFFPTVLELAQWEQIVNAGTEIKNFHSGNQQVIAAAYEFKSQQYYILLNRSNQVQEITINDLPDLDFYAFPEAKKLPVKSGKITFKIPPFGIELFATASTLPAPAYALPPANPQLERHSGNFFTEFKKYVFTKLGGAKWIWFPGQSRLAHAKVSASKNFKLEQLPESAKLFVAVDDSYQASVNGKKVASGASWTKIAEVDITQLLKIGENNIVIDGVNEYGRCGMIAKIILNFADGKSYSINTDNSWKVTDAQQKNASAEVLGDFGANGTWTWMRMD